MRNIQRVLFNSTDISHLVNDFRTGAFTFPYTAGDYLYIGSELPFSHLYFEMGTLNNVSATVTVENWWGNAWTPCVDVFDGTNGLSTNGLLQWVPQRLKGWDLEQDSSDVAGLSGTSIYYFYWLRLSWNATLLSAMTLKYIGQKFSEDSQLLSYYPDLGIAQLKTSFAAGKTTWDEQHYMAAEMIIRDMISRKIIISRGQVVDSSRLLEASCHKVAEIVYRGLGRAYMDDANKAVLRYASAMNKDFFRVDSNASGSLDPIEKAKSTRFMSR